MKRLPPLIELRAFEAVARHLSFKAAAAELGVTPTAISHQIKLLEQHCGQPLFRRRPRPLALTWAGEHLFPVMRDGFESFADALAIVRARVASGRLRVTATNAFAARWLVPRLPRWRQEHPRLRLDIVGTDAVLNLGTREADVAIRYARTPPSDGHSLELVRDAFHVVGSASLVDTTRRLLSPADLARFPLIECEWRPTDTEAPNWQRWEDEARLHHKTVPEPGDSQFQRGTAHHRSGDRWAGPRDMQRRAGWPGAGQRHAGCCFGYHAAWLRLLHRPPTGSPERSLDQGVRQLGARDGVIADWSMTRCLFARR